MFEEKLFDIIFSSSDYSENRSLLDQIHKIENDKVDSEKLAFSLEHWVCNLEYKIKSDIESNIKTYHEHAITTAVGVSGITTGSDEITKVYWTIYQKSIKKVDFLALALIVINKFQLNQLKLF